MREYFIRPGFDFIQLFAEGGGGEGGTGARAAAAAAEGQNSADLAQPQTQGAKNPLAEVQYGTEADPADAGQGEGAEDRAARFDALIRGEFKDLYESKIKETVSRRLKGTEDTVNRYNALGPMLSLLAEKYGVDANDADALIKAVEDDESFYEEEALEKGLSVAQVKEIRRIERENAQLRAQMQEQQAREKADQTLAAWMKEAEQIKEIYPSFDLRAELENPDMQRLLKANVPMRTAYEAIHKDEIISGAMQYTAGKIAAKVANNVIAGKSRPAEGAMGGRSAVTTKRDVSQLTAADRAEIIRRAERGALIGFD